MNKTISLKVNFIMNTILTMSSLIFPVISFPYVSRVLMPDGIGKISFATSVVSYFAMIAQLGIPIYGVRACARVRDNKDELTRTVQEIVIINLIMSVLVYCSFFALLIFIPRLHQEKTLFIILSSTIIFNVVGVEWFYKALEQYTYIAVRSIVFKFISLLMMFLLVHSTEDYVMYGGISIFAASASNLLNFFNMRKHISLKPVGNYKFSNHLKAITIFFAMSCATTVYTQLDTVMLGFMRTDMEVGYYNAAVKIKTILVSLVTSLGVVLLPRASYYIENNNKKDFFRITGKALNFVVLLAVPMMVYFIQFGEESILFLSGEAYQNSILPMKVIMPTILLIGMTNIMGIQVLVPTGKEKVVLNSVITGAVINLLINYILIPRFSSVGAAIGTLVAEFVVWIVQYIALKDVLEGIYKKIKYRSIIIALLCSSVISGGIKLIELPIFLSLLFSAILFFGVYLGILTILKEPLVISIEKQIVSRLIKNRDIN